MFYPAHCDHVCTGCEKNYDEWCIFRDVPTSNINLKNAKSSTINSTNADKINIFNYE